jgi:hypothetical protein
MERTAVVVGDGTDEELILKQPKKNCRLDG